MKNLLLVLFSLLSFSSILSQEVKIIYKADSIPNIKEKGLAFISEKTDLKAYYNVAKIEIEANDFNSILSSLQKTAISFSANAFKFIDKKVIDNNIKVTFDLYAANLSLLNENKKNLETNVIYFFGNDTKEQTFKINSEKIKLETNQVFRYELLKNDKIKINKGGFTGMTVMHYWKENQAVIFYAFGSGNLSSYGNGTSYIGLSMNTGKILELKNDFAYLLMELRKE